jgi:hypothetical protein
LSANQSESGLGNGLGGMILDSFTSNASLRRIRKEEENDLGKYSKV